MFNERHYNQKIFLLFVLLISTAVIAPVIIFNYSYSAYSSSKNITSLSRSKSEALDNQDPIFQFEEQAQSTRKIVQKLRTSNTYSPDEKAVDEILKTSGIDIDNISVKDVPAANLPKLIPQKRGVVWKNLSFANVVLQGHFQLAKLPEVLSYISTMEKFWYISSLEIRPLDNPSDFISRFRKIELEVANSRNFEKDSVIEAIEKRQNKNQMQISISFFAPISTAIGGISQ